MKRGFIILALLGVSGSAGAESGDPCDFASKKFLHRQQVLECYRSVPFDPADRDNQFEVFSRFLEFSDLRSTYDAQVNWRRQLAWVGRRSFRSDFDMVQAFQSVTRSFRNLHFIYLGPSCYNSIVFPFIPLGFGSRVAAHRRGGHRQVIFVDSIGLPDEYLEATGIDATAFLGQEVVRIDGRDPVSFLRGFGRRELQIDAKDLIQN